MFERNPNFSSKTSLRAPPSTGPAFNGWQKTALYLMLFLIVHLRLLSNERRARSNEHAFDMGGVESILPGMSSGSCIFRKCIACYDVTNLYFQKAHCLVWFQDPPSLESISTGMISQSFVIRKYELVFLTLYLFCECLRMCFYTCWWFLCKYSFSSRRQNCAFSGRFLRHFPGSPKWKM